MIFLQHAAILPCKDNKKQCFSILFYMIFLQHAAILPSKDNKTQHISLEFMNVQLYYYLEH